MSDRCEPPEHLRDRDGPHWVQKRDTAPILIEWEMPKRWPETGGAWRIARHAVVPAAAYKHGYRYLCPIATPAEVEALRRERDAAVEAWKANERRADQCRQTAETHRSDNATLRVANARLREALETYKREQCEGFCFEAENWFGDCAGCIARIALKEPTP